MIHTVEGSAAHCAWVMRDAAHHVGDRHDVAARGRVDQRQDAGGQQRRDQARPRNPNRNRHRKLRERPHTMDLVGPAAGAGFKEVSRAPFAPFTKPCTGPCGRRAGSPLIQPKRARGERPETTMTQTTNRFFDEVARLMNDAAGVAQGVRREFDTLFRTQAERILRDLDVVKREEFEAVKEMARLAREENEALKARIAALEAKLGRASRRSGPARPGSEPRLRPRDSARFSCLCRRHGYKPRVLRLQHPWRHAAGDKPSNFGLKHED